MWIVMSLASERVYGHFDTERLALKWAEDQGWTAGFMVRKVEDYEKS